MSEHTPGPWKVDYKYCVGPISREDDQSYGMVLPIADVYGPNRQADAELIASAPALRDEVARLKEQLKNAQAETWTQAARRHSDRDGNPCEYCLYQAAAITPQAGKGGGA